MYPWPVGNFDYVMDEALDIAMNYLLLKRLISELLRPWLPTR
jgi:hypothetical protein